MLNQLFEGILKYGNLTLLNNSTGIGWGLFDDKNSNAIAYIPGLQLMAHLEVGDPMSCLMVPLNIIGGIPNTCIEASLISNTTWANH